MKWLFYYSTVEPAERGEIRTSGVSHDLQEVYEREICSGGYVNFVWLEVRGKTYKEKKDYLRWLAVWIHCLESEVGTLSMGEWAELESFFRMEARRLGLVHEFEENGII